jgi:hypothetical protein
LHHISDRATQARKMAQRKGSCMSTRRTVLQAAPLLAAPAALAFGGGSTPYHAAAEALRHRAPTPPTGTGAVQRELVRCATLAANSHNTQPWRFESLSGAIVIRPDLQRRTPAVDPDDHHLWASLGCATENLVQAAAAFGRRAQVGLAGDRVVITLTDDVPRRTPLFEAIAQRQCTRSDYDGGQVASADLHALATAAAGPELRCELIVDRARLDNVAQLVAEATAAQMHDPRFVAELKAWIRFSDAEALTHGDGLAARATGNPSVPRWLGSLMFGFIVSARRERARYLQQVRSSSGVAVFVSARNDRAAWVEAGRAYQRFALQATALGLRNAFVNQPVEVPALRLQFSRWLGLNDARPDFVVRFGRGPRLPHSLRRPLDEVIA